MELKFGNCVHTTKVTYLGKGLWGCRVFVDGVLSQECAVDSRRKINAAFRHMLRIEDKCGNISELGDTARERLNKSTPYEPDPRGSKSTFWDVHVSC